MSLFTLVVRGVPRLHPKAEFQAVLDGLIWGISWSAQKPHVVA